MQASHSFSFSYENQEIRFVPDVRNKFATQYTMIDKIGEGQFGLVYKCKSHTNNTFVAVKRTKEKYEGVKDRL